MTSTQRSSRARSAERARLAELEACLVALLAWAGGLEGQRWPRPPAALLERIRRLEL